MAKEYDWRPLERERVKALMNQDAGEYARLCYELGVDPEDKYLYDRGVQPEFDLGGLEDSVIEEDIIPLNKRKRSVSNGIYQEFYDRGIGLNSNPFLDTGAKADLLREYFPNKGDTSDMTPRQIGGKFSSMLKYAKRRINE
jgi:hypothetical protein